ncbi:hypothetical protein TrispH2_004532 [Trichoplax sp. H2]|nr:hypothetical protein TrispH2_004532 [Trichoplax sp. H2]|eukprot:RDD44052.1 hypothetical protein TrispH2_004532 [Trichoplax sp. H2]
MQSRSQSDSANGTNAKLAHKANVTAAYEIQKNLKYDFKDSSLLLTALGKDNKLDTSIGLPGRYGNQQILEMIGDAWLRFVVLYKLYEMKEHTDGSAKSFNDATKWLVSNDTVLPEIGKRLGLEKCIRNITDKKKYLANYTEAILGAAVIDDRNLHRSFQVVDRLWSPYINTYKNNDNNCDARPLFVSQEITNQNQANDEKTHGNDFHLPELIPNADYNQTDHDSQSSKESFAIGNDDKKCPYTAMVNPDNVTATVKPSTEAHHSNESNQFDTAESNTVIKVKKVAINTTVDSHVDGLSVAQSKLIVQKAFSSFCNSLSVFQKMVSQLPDINCRHGSAGDTILMKIVTASKLNNSKKLERIQFLLDHGASWNVKNNEGLDALSICQSKNPDLILQLKRKGLISNDGQINDADKLNDKEQDNKIMLNRHIVDPDAIKHSNHVASNVTVNSHTEGKSTPQSDLMEHKAFSSYCSNFNMFKNIITQVSNVNYRHGKAGETILMKIITTKNLDNSDKLQRIQLLRNCGASWKLKNFEGLDALSICQRKNPDLMSLLKLKGLIGNNVQEAPTEINKKEDGVVSPTFNRNQKNKICELSVVKNDDRAIDKEQENINNLFSNHCNSFSNLKMAVNQVKDINCKKNDDGGDNILMTILKCTRLADEKKIERIRFLLSRGASWKATNNSSVNAVNVGLKYCPQLMNTLIEQGRVDQHALKKCSRLLPTSYSNQNTVKDTKLPKTAIVNDHIQLVDHAINDNNKALFPELYQDIDQFKTAVLKLPDLNSTWISGNTILMTILQSPFLDSQEKIEKIEILVQLGASWYATNEHGKNAIDVGLKACPKILAKLIRADSVKQDNIFQSKVKERAELLTRTGKFQTENAFDISQKDNVVELSCRKDNTNRKLFTHYCKGMDRFKEIIKESSNLNCRNDGKVGNTVLILILLNETMDDGVKVDRIKLLVSSGASWYTANNCGMNAIDIGLQSCPKFLADLIEQGLVGELSEHDTDSLIDQSSNGITVSTNQSYSTSDSDASASTPLVQGQEKDDAMLKLSYCNSIDKFRDSIQKLSNINVRNSGKSGDTILMTILQIKRLDEPSKIERIKILLSSKASWYATNNRGQNAIDLCLQKYPDLLAKLIRMKLIKQDDIFKSVAQEKATMIQSIIGSDRNGKRSANMKTCQNSIGRNGNSKFIELISSTETLNDPIIFTCYCGNMDKFKDVVQAAKTLDCRNSGKIGNTLLMMLLQSKRLDKNSKIERIKLVVSFGASWYAVNKQGQNAIDIGLQLCPDLLASLVEQGLVKYDKSYCIKDHQGVAIDNSSVMPASVPDRKIPPYSSASNAPSIPTYGSNAAYPYIFPSSTTPAFNNSLAPINHNYIHSGLYPSQGLVTSSYMPGQWLGNSPYPDLMPLFAPPVRSKTQHPSIRL